MIPSSNSESTELELLALTGIPRSSESLSNILSSSGLKSNQLTISVTGLEDSEQLVLDVAGKSVIFSENSSRIIEPTLPFFEGREVTITTTTNLTPPRTCTTDDATIKFAREDVSISYRCGEFPVPIRGTISGLVGSISLSLTGGSTITVEQNGQFSFPDSDEDFVGTTKSVTINSYSNFGEIYCEGTGLSNFTLQSGSNFTINCYENLIQDYNFENLALGNYGENIPVGSHWTSTGSDHDAIITNTDSGIQPLEGTKMLKYILPDGGGFGGAKLDQCFLIDRTKDLIVIANTNATTTSGGFRINIESYSDSNCSENRTINRDHDFNQSTISSWQEGTFTAGHQSSNFGSGDTHGHISLRARRFNGNAYYDRIIVYQK
ncbi:MAG: hypothetical protein JJT78_01185 [Leptospira sp.]|nr:hypothetical protein [Leptospira sp.]